MTLLSPPCARPAHPDELQSKARAVNRRLLETQRVGQGCVLASPAFERIARPKASSWSGEVPLSHVRLSRFSRFRYDAPGIVRECDAG